VVNRPDIEKLQSKITCASALLCLRHLTTTQLYDKRRIATSQSASHDAPI
jgi:hypothetical protein